MKIRLVTINNLVFHLYVKGNDFNDIVSKIFERKYIKVSDNTFLQTSAIAMIQNLGK